MARYEICPKCCLNYIDLDAQEICDICKKTMLGQRTVGDDLSLDAEFEDEELQSPFIQKTMDIAEQYEEEKYNEDEDENDDNATWRGFIDIDDDLESPDFQIDEEFDNDEDEEIEEAFQTAEDDFEYVSADDYCADDDEDDDEADDTDYDF